MSLVRKEMLLWPRQVRPSGLLGWGPRGVGQETI